MDIVTTGPFPEDVLAMLPTLPPKAQLEQILELLAVADDCEDRLERLTSKAWAYLVDNQLWQAKTLTEEQVKEQVDWLAVSRRLTSFQRSQARKECELRGIVKVWGRRPDEVLGVGLWPEEPSLHLLRQLNRLSKVCASPAEIQVLLGDAVRRRVSDATRRRTSACSLSRWASSSHVLVVDRETEPTVEPVVGPEIEPEAEPTIANQQEKRGKQPKPVKPTAKASQSESSLRPCRCPLSLSGLVPGPGAILGDEQGLALLGQAQKAGIESMCQPHLRLLAAGALGLHNNKSRKTICRHLELVYRHRLNLQKLKVKKPGWFRRDKRPAVAQDQLGVSRHFLVGRAGFSFDEVQVFDRFAGSGSWQKWDRDGTINVGGVFSYLDLPDLWEMIDTEFGIYRHHHRTLPGTSCLGWLRNMYYSLVQQLARQDPVWYALTVAARPDKLWRLISYPYITKDTGTGGEATGFLHMDLDLEAFLEDGWGGSRLTSSLSLDDEDGDGCTVVVKGFHRHLAQWAQALQQRGWKGLGPTTNCSSIFTAEDRAQWGEVEGVPCPAWSIRITLPQLIHRSTPKSVRRRRTILPWFMGIGEDHEQLEIPSCASWSEVRDCYLDLVPTERDPSGSAGQFISPRRHPAWAPYVQRVQASLVEQYRKAFSTMAQAEREEFGATSYFRTDPLGVESGNESDDYSMGSLGSGHSSDDE
ncbi:MAG: hypothetical protein M1840_006388 [Geoglossum simile]|nr:MAG: hypothetical protein M1840_006388 [Geoglossum simile]